MPTGIYIRTEYHKKRLGESHRGLLAGNKHPNWKGGITPLRKKAYASQEYKLWRKSVFERDNYTCVWCKERGGELTADHIKQWAYFPELRYELSNGRTLCICCHRKSHTWGSWDYKKRGVKLVGNVNSGSFKKGHVGYKAFLGKKLSPEHVKKISEANKRWWDNKKAQTNATI